MSRTSMLAAVGAALLSLVLPGCSGGLAPSDAAPALRISAIPDRDPAELGVREQAMADYLAAALGVEVEYVPVTDYAASVSLFKTGDLDLVFYGGLTGVQARRQVPGAVLLAQRDIDERFRSVFIASSESGLAPVASVAGLTALRGHRFTYGSESSTSGRLMPEYFLAQAGVDGQRDFTGSPGYSGSHDKTVDLVESGSYEVGVLNAQVWQDRVEAETVDRDKVRAIFTTPTYHDYHWIAGPELDERLGDGFTPKLGRALLDLDGSDATETDLLKRYGARSLVATAPANYDQIEEIASQLRLLP